jgi:hypothetical protein
MIGMLWLGESRLSLEENVQKAADYYIQKYGRRPAWCFANPKEVAGETRVGGMTVKPMVTILPRHLWLGVGS